MYTKCHKGKCYGKWQWWYMLFVCLCFTSFLMLVCLGVDGDSG